jgi:iron complex outermembrane receptor protein
MRATRRHRTGISQNQQTMTNPMTKLKLAGVGACALIVAVLLPAQTATPASTPAPEPVTVLEKFIINETATTYEDSLSQTGRPVDNVFLGSRSVFDTPRSVTILTAESIKQFGVKTFDDLDRVGAGLTRPNIFGIPGLPFIRGDNASVYYNGMLRIPNQNETPTSFGSLDAMDIVKGPAPAQFGPTNGGGYVNFLPKSPYFDKFRGSVQLSIGSYDYFNTQVDVGGPVLLLGKPMAYRISITEQKAHSYYNDIKNDYTSIYLSAKSRLSDKLTLFTGGEYYDFKSNENAGWNRLTQDLINNSNYIIGNIDPNTTSAAYHGYADPRLLLNQVDIAFNTGYDPNLALVVPVADFQARFGAPTGAGSAYTSGAAAAATPVFYQGSLYGYKYTPDYFAGGGQLFTKKIEGNQVVSDAGDYANSKTFLGFLDLVYAGDGGRTYSAKTLIETIKTRKISSYGFAHDSDSYAIQEKFLVDESHTWGGVAVALQYGLDLRYTYNNDANDFGVEPFNRRDVSDPIIPPQAIVLVGPQLNWPAGYVGGGRSKLRQAGLFGQFATKFSDSFTVYGGFRAEGASFDTTSSPTQFATQVPFRRGGKNYMSASINPIFKINNMVSLYAAVQNGTVLTPGQTGGVSGGEGNFAKTPFYEGGVKFNLLKNTLYASAAAYQFEKSTLATIPIGGVDSSRYRAKGYELELTYTPTKNLSVVANLGETKAKYLTRFPFATRPFTPEQVALYSGSIQYGPFGQGPGGSRYVNNPEGYRAGLPEQNANLYVVYQFDNGFGAGVGPSWKKEFWLNNEHTIKLPASTVWNANLFYKAKRFELLLRLSNFTNEDYFIGSSFAPTMIVTKAKPFEANLTTTIKF